MTALKKVFKHEGHKVHEGFNEKAFPLYPFVPLCLIGFAVLPAA